MPSFSTLTASLFLAVHAGGLVSAAPAPVLGTVDAAVHLREVDGPSTPPFSPKQRAVNGDVCGNDCDPGVQDRRVKARQPPEQKREINKKGCGDDACGEGGNRRVKARQPPKQKRLINDDPTGPNQRSVDAPGASRKRESEDANDDTSGASGARPIRRAEEDPEDFFTPPPDPNAPPANDVGDGSRVRAVEAPEDFFTPPPDPNAPPANDVGDGSRVRAVEAPAGASRKRDDAGPLDSDDAGPF